MAETTSTSSSLPASALASGVDFEPEKLLTDLIVVAHGPEDFQGFLRQVVEQVRQQLHLPAAGILSWEGQSAQSVVSPATGIPVLRVQSGNLSESSSDSDRLVLVPLDVRQKAWGVLQLAEEREGQLKDIASRLSSLGRAIAGIIALRQQRDGVVSSREALLNVADTGIHDLNNPLTALMGGLELAMRAPEVSSSLLDDSLHFTQTIRDRLITLRAALYSAQPELHPRSLAGLIQSVIRTMSQHPLLARVSMGCDFEDDMTLAVDAQLFSRALENLLVNAGRALMGREGAIICIRLVRDVVIDESSSFHLDPGVYAHVTVEDNGPGIPQHLLSKLFRDRVTSHEDPTRHGLGLMSVRTAMIFHGAHVFVETSTVQPTFTRFHLLLPQHPSSLRH